LLEKVLKHSPGVLKKISLSPPFDLAQGRLFQRGVKACTERIPPLKKGDRGGFEFEFTGCCPF
jgi:hypothetical protein